MDVNIDHSIKEDLSKVYQVIVECINDTEQWIWQIFHSYDTALQKGV